MSGIVSFMALFVSFVAVGFTFWAHRRAEQKTRRINAYRAAAEEAAARAERSARESQMWAQIRTGRDSSAGVR